MLQIKSKNLSKPHLPFTEKYAFILWNTDFNFGREVIVRSEFCLLLSLMEKKSKAPPIQCSLRLGIIKFPWRFSLLWGHSSPGLPGQCKMVVPHQALLSSCPGSRTENREPLLSILSLLVLNTPSVFCWAESSLCSHHCTEHSPEELS